MTRTTGRLEDAYDILAQTPEYILCRSREANPVHTYAVQRLDRDSKNRCQHKDHDQDPLAFRIRILLPGIDRTGRLGLWKCQDGQGI